MALKFDRILLDKENKCEACSVFDVNEDGIADIVCGEYWYQGPDFKVKHKIASIPYEHGYVHDFSDYPLDVNGDGRLDIVTGSWWSEGLYWRENPGSDGEWTTHKADTLTCVETIRYFDIDNCGTVEVFPNCPGEPACFFKLVKDENGKGTGKFVKYVIGEVNANHGMGFGDVNGDGKTDLLLSNGWLEQPSDVYGKWIMHKEWEMPMASVPMLLHDVNGDGLPDIIVGVAHGYGLYWYEQKLTDGGREWIKHAIDEVCSQYHDMQLFDIDKDGKLELVTGARHFAHNGNDPGELNPIGSYYFKINGVNFDKITLDYGPAETTSGMGIYFWLADLDGSGWTDIVAPGKEGLYIFKNLGV
jgi:hypothetical protein